MPFNFTDSSNIGKEYKGFILLSVDSLPDYKANAVYLRHKTTGLEVYHIIADDNENLFSFAFRTLSKNSKGCAHIIEHSVLCGSEKFPLKEPFSTLESQSVKTFLNAMTYPDKTAYPASSLVRSDYFNLMDVYADAVFFPLLSEKTFMQEGHRYELSDEADGENLSIQGVVYNEMKANYASFNAVAIDLPINKMYPDSIYAYDSGGDPLEIPSLTYEEFRAFHKKFYNPSNCLLFLYGDISTADQLDFINEKYIGRLEEKFGKSIAATESDGNINSPFPYLSEEIKELQKMPQIPETTKYRDFAPDVGSTGELVNVTWYTGESDVEKMFLSEVLIGNDSSPMSIALKESKLGDDLSPLCGNFGQFPQENIFSFGLMGVSKKNENKVRQLIFDSLEDIYEKGIPQADIDSAIMGIDFNLREVTRYFGPYSLGIMSKVLSAWANGYKIDKFLNPITTFENFKKKIAEDKDFTRNLLKKYFLDNQKYLFSVIEPSKTYISDRNKKEAELIKQAEKSINKEELKLQLKELHEYQQKKESDEELNCIPHLSIDDLDKDYDHTKEYIPVKYFQIESKDNQKIPVVYNDEKTNGLVYMELYFPIDSIAPEDFKTLPLFAEIITELGWNGKKWNDCFAEANCITGDIWSNVVYGSLRQHPDVQNEIAKYENKNIFGHCYIAICTKFLAEKSEEVFKLLTEIVTKMDFKDKKRFGTILTEYKTEKKSSFMNAASHYLTSRLKAYKSKTGAINEIFYGITQFNYADKLSKKDIPYLLKKYESFYKKMFDEGCLIHVTSDEASLATIDKYLPDFCKESQLKAPVSSAEYDMEAYTKQIYVPENNSENKASSAELEVCKISTQSGFAAMGTSCSLWPSKENSAEDILCNYLDNHALWQKIRMTGGAYGASCSADGTNRLFRVSSWRDPTPAKTLKTYMEILEETANTKISQADVERAIISCYSDKIVPDSPSARGNRGFNRFIFVVTKEMLRQDFENLFDITSDDVEKAAKRIYENAKTDRKEVVICDNSTDICGKLLKVEL